MDILNRLKLNYMLRMILPYYFHFEYKAFLIARALIDEYLKPLYINVRRHKKKIHDKFTYSLF